MTEEVRRIRVGLRLRRSKGVLFYLDTTVGFVPEYRHSTHGYRDYIPTGFSRVYPVVKITSN